MVASYPEEQQFSEFLYCFREVILISFYNVYLKKIDSQVFLQQNEFIQEQRIAIWDIQSNGEPRRSPENKEEKHSFIVEKGVQMGFCKQSPLEETGSSKCSGFSLAEL